MDTVLIAEDDAVFLRRLQRQLVNLSKRINIIGVPNGRVAMDVFQRRVVKVLVTDIQMPEMDGLELLAFVNEHHPATPCFVMTAYETKELKRKVAGDVITFFSKPFEIKLLGHAVLNTLDRDIPRGALHGISVLSFVQMILMEGKTCLFEVKLPDDRQGLFYFEKGVLFDAVCGSLKGEDAAREMLGVRRASFRFRDFPGRQVNRRIETNVEQLLEEAQHLENDAAITEALESLDFVLPISSDEPG